MSQSKQTSAASAAAQILEDAKQSAMDLLKEHHDVLRIQVNSRLTMLINQLRFMDGQSPVIENKNVLTRQTEFMGEKIQESKPIETEQLSPKEQEIKNLTANADALQANLANLTDQQVVEANKVDPRPIRLLAKRAGLTDFKDAKINENYIKSIRAGFLKQEEDTKRKAEEEKGLKESAKKNEGTNK